MPTLFVLIKKEFLQIRRNKVLLPLMLIMPVMQMMVLSFAANYEVRNLALGVVDRDLSPMSRQLVNKFAASGYFKIQNSAFSSEVVQADMAADRNDLIVEIPPDFEKSLVREGKASVILIANAINTMKGGLGIGYASAIVQDFNQELLTNASWLPPAGANRLASGTITVTYSNWYNPRLDYKTFMVPGILGTIISIIIGFMTALNIVREREIGTIEQINVTPVKPWEFILGKLTPFWLISLVMMAVGLTVGWLVFKIPIEGDIWLIFVYTMTYTPCMLGIGFLISNFSATQQQAMFTVWFFMIIFILMSGLFTPLESMPEWARYLNILNPVHYFVEFMRLVLLKGANFYEIRTNYLSILTYGIVMNALAVLTYQKRN